MDAALFTRMLSDPMLVHLKKLKYKYPQTDLSEFIPLLQDGFYRSLPLYDFHGNPIVYLENAVQLEGCSSALFVPLSEYIERIRKQYYDAFSLVEQNARISGVLDVTPFLLYFTEEVYHKLRSEQPDRATKFSTRTKYQVVMEASFFLTVF